jgi:class 3 adenylate cyclase
VLVGLGAVLALLAAAIALLGSRWMLFRSRWAREIELKRKRAKGPPKGGSTVSVVVTDIEGYSELMKTSPNLTTKALNMHNAVLRKAAHLHAGHVFEQEGDSWAVAFHDATDAVAFCLQAQQALHRVGLGRACLCFPRGPALVGSGV